jgi:YtkA-like
VLLLVAVAAFGWHKFGPAPMGTDMARTRLTDAGLYTVSIAPEKEPFDRNAMHSWVVDIKDKAGQPVEGAKLLIDGGMPRHGHGLPTAPEMTDELGAGKYRVDGVRFHMFGWWEFSFDIDAAPGRDKIVFNLQL